MAVRLRMRRVDKFSKENYHFRIVAVDCAKARDGSFIEELGFYNPAKNPAYFKLNMERVNYWLKCGAQPSATVASLIKKTNKEKK